MDHSVLLRRYEIEKSDNKLQAITNYYKNKNWLQFLLIVKAAVLKHQNFIRKFNAQKLAITFISVSGLS